MEKSLTESMRGLLDSLSNSTPEDRMEYIKDLIIDASAGQGIGDYDGIFQHVTGQDPSIGSDEFDATVEWLKSVGAWHEEEAEERGDYLLHQQQDRDREDGY